MRSSTVQSLSQHAKEASTVPCLQRFRIAVSLFLLLQAMQPKAADTSVCCTILYNLHVLHKKIIHCMHTLNEYL